VIKTKQIKWSAIALAALLASGCSTMNENDTNSEGAVVEDGSGDGALTNGMVDGGSISGGELNDPNSPLYTKVIYFDFDQATIRQDSISTLRAHADYLIRTDSSNVLVEGHCDERGSREYNIALGERRAKVIQSFLEAEGVKPAQIDTISYGEERPAVNGSDESSWGENRRAVLGY